MRIQIENYFGNDIMELKYCSLDSTISIDNSIVVGTLASTCGYDIADEDIDENGMYIRLQQVNVDNTEKDGRKDIIELVNKLNTYFLH